MSKTPAEIFAEAKQAAYDAAVAQNAKLPDENSRGFDCGFAWITIRPARGPFVAYLKSAGIGKTGGYEGGSGYGIWYSDVSLPSTQSVSVHEAAVEAAANVLKANGVNASWNSRLD